MRHLWFALSFLVLAVPASAQVATPDTASVDAALAEELAEVRKLDQDGRMWWRRVQSSFGGTTPDSLRLAFWKVQEVIDAQTFARVDSIVAARGWPGISVAGEDGALAAFLVVQHAPLEAQERYIPILEAAVAAGEAEPWHLAYLTDRVLIRTDRPQRYGSQYRVDPETGEESYLPIEDEERLNARRVAIGMPELDGFPPADE